MDRGAIWHEFADIPVYPVSVAMIDMAAPPDFLVKLVSAAANGGALFSSVARPHAHHSTVLDLCSAPQV